MQWDVFLCWRLLIIIISHEVGRLTNTSVNYQLTEKCAVACATALKGLMVDDYLCQPWPSTFSVCLFFFVCVLFFSWCHLCHRTRGLVAGQWNSSSFELSPWDWRRWPKMMFHLSTVLWFSYWPFLLTQTSVRFDKLNPDMLLRIL